MKKTTPSDPDAGGVTPVRHFRLSDDVVAKLDAIAEHLADETGSQANRSDAVRYAVHRVWREITSQSSKARK